jgi:glc operon protein GlcG
MLRPLLRTIAVGVLVSAASLVPGSSAAAQVRTARLIAVDGAQRAMAAALAEAKKQGWQVSIAVVDNSGDLVGFLRMDGAPVSSVDIAQGKARTAARMRRATRILDSTLTAGRTPILGLNGIVPVEGGVPIVVDGEVIGAVGVSGATSAQDAQVARAGIAAVLP